MAWTVSFKSPVVEHLRWFGRKNGRRLMKAIVKRLQENPLAESRNMKPLRTNPVAQWQLRLFDKYRALFDVDEETNTVTVVTVGEKRGNALVVMGKEFTEHYESHTPEQG